jgi:hypothetical protein
MGVPANFSCIARDKNSSAVRGRWLTTTRWACPASLNVTAPTEIGPTIMDTFESRATPADELALAIRDLARDFHEFVDAGQDSYDENADKRSNDYSRYTGH